MKLYGSFHNRLMEDSRQPEPEIGMGATMTSWSDRHAGTIIEVRRFKSGARQGQVREVVVQADKAIRIDRNGMSESQSYDYESDPQGQTETFRPTQNGWRSAGRGLLIGQRHQYHDYSF